MRLPASRPSPAVGIEARERQMAADAVEETVRRTAFAARDAEQTTEFFRQAYVDNRTRFLEVDPHRSSVTTRAAAAGPVEAHWTRTSVSLEVETAPLGFLLCGRLRGGRVQLSTPQEEVALRSGGAALWPVTAPLRTRSEQMDFPFLRLPLERVARVAGERADLRGSRLRFHSVRPVSAAATRSFGRVLDLVHAELDAPGPDSLPTLLVERLADLAAASVLMTFPNSTSTLAHEPSPGNVGPATVRRAAAFIDAHADDPITVSDVAAAAGVGPRALQQGFARHAGTSPTGYLRRVRLERARHDLRAADPAGPVTVAQVAARWGFGHPGRFAAAYRQTFGESPGDTLRG